MQKMSKTYYAFFILPPLIYNWALVGQWKYLETRFLEAAKDMDERIAARLRGLFKGGR